MKLQFTFLPIPEELMKSKALSFGAKFLFGIYGKANKEKVRWSAKYLAERMGCEVREVRNRKAELIKNNLIVVNSRRGRVDEVSVNFELVHLVQEKTPAQTDRGANEQGTPAQNEQGRGVRTGQGNSEEHSLNNPIKEKEALTPSQEMKLFLEEREYLDKIATAIIRKSNASPDIIIRELLKFRSYWSELNGTGQKQRWQLEKTFELKRRIAKWFNNAAKFNQSKPKGKEIII